MLERAASKVAHFTAFDHSGGTPPSCHRERDSDGFSVDRFSECSERSISDRFRGVRDGIGDATSEGFKVVKLKLAQPLEDEAVEEPGAANESDLIPPTSSATRVAAALDAAWPDTLLFAVAIGNLATSDVLPFAQRLDLPGPQQRELSARLGEVESMPIRRRLAYGPAPDELDLCQSLELWASAGCPKWRVPVVLVAKPLACTDADRHSDLMESARNAAAAGLAAKTAAATAARKAAGLATDVLLDVQNQLHHGPP